eukprot:snap_masked-scaffold_48-processed-gene-1.108-mRNA-1 protein AED:1.00 eAED:1.00 QI:0/0/0/0/1/1/2/0/62
MAMSGSRTVNDELELYENFSFAHLMTLVVCAIKASAVQYATKGCSSFFIRDAWHKSNATTKC